MNEAKCATWFDQWIKWRSGELSQLPPKPQGFDIWLLGDNPLKLDIGEGRLEPLIKLSKPATRQTPSHNFSIQLELKLDITPNDTPHV